MRAGTPKPIAHSYGRDHPTSPGPAGPSRPAAGTEKPRPTEVYVVRFEGVGGFTFHKVGITSVRTWRRFGEKPNGYAYTQLRRFVFPDRDAALSMEERILRALRGRRPYAGLSGQGPLPSGNSEVIVAPEAEILRTADRIAAAVPGWSGQYPVREYAFHTPSVPVLSPPPRAPHRPHAPVARPRRRARRRRSMSVGKLLLIALTLLAILYAVPGDAPESVSQPEPSPRVERAPLPEVTPPQLPPPAYTPKPGVVVPPVK